MEVMPLKVIFYVCTSNSTVGAMSFQCTVHGTNLYNVSAIQPRRRNFEVQ
jgi:hypothetical protein